MSHNHIPEFNEGAMKEMTGAGKNHHRQFLGSRPVEHVAEQYDVIFLTMNDECLLGDVANGKSADSRRNQHQMTRRALLCRRLRYVTAERESGEDCIDIAKPPFRMRVHAEKIFQLTPAIVEYTLTSPNPTKIESQGRIPEAVKGLGKRLHNLVVQGSSMKRMRVRNDRIADTVVAGIGNDDLQLTGRTVNTSAFVVAGFQIRKRSTMMPLTRCLAIISSTSCLST